MKYLSFSDISGKYEKISYFFLKTLLHPDLSGPKGGQ